MPKNIVIFSDGTGQEGGRRHNTNVYKLFHMVEDRTPDQIVFYDRGVGTGAGVLTGIVGGRGFARNVRDCYQFIFENFEAGDRLILIGFSRGAATVRSLSYFLHLFGILPHSRPELIPRAWKIYKIRNAARRERAAARFVERYHTMWTKVHFLGCYDTVSALGLPWRIGSVLLDALPGLRHRFHNLRLSPSVVNAVHALSIDDERLTFHPVLWDPEVAPGQTIRQVWFAGMHSDVGGGYRRHQLSDIPLVWLTQQAVENGLRIYGEHRVDIQEDANGHMHDSRAHPFGRLFRRRVRAWDSTRSDRPIVHESVLKRVKGRTNRDSPPYAPWILKETHEVEPWIPHAEQTWYAGPARDRKLAHIPGLEIAQEPHPRP